MSRVIEPVEILLVEDNPDDVELTLRIFRTYNISNKVQVAEDGAEALEYLLRQGPFAQCTDPMPKVVLLDLKLPKVGGVEVLETMKKDPVLRTIPVVVLTSSREDRDIEKCYELGVNSYIVKPVDFVQFGESVRQMGLYWVLLNQIPTTRRVTEKTRSTD